MSIAEKLGIWRRRSYCWFFQEGLCIIHRRFCFLCPSYMKAISGMHESKDYLSLVDNRRLATRALLLSIYALLIAFLAFLFNIVKFFLERHS
jgi:hypothetical protein